METGTKRLVGTVAWMYHIRGLRQKVIAQRLKISQSRVSRLLEQASDLHIVRTVLVVPSDAQTILESELQSAYGLTNAFVYDIGQILDESQLVRELGRLLAAELQNLQLDVEVIALTSWSRTVQATVRYLQPLPTTETKFVVETLGDLGSPSLQHLAASNTERFAALAGAEPMFLRVPGVMPSLEVKQTRLAYDSYARATLAKLDAIDLAVIGVGSVDVVPPLRAGDNFFTADQVAQAKVRGAVGEINLHYIGADGELVHTDFHDLVVGASAEQLRRTPRRLAAAGGPSKYPAIRAALRGHWINYLLTDSNTAQWLLAQHAD